MTEKTRNRLSLGLIILLLFARYVLPRLVPQIFLYAAIGGVLVGLQIIVWWLLFSRAPWSERVGALVLMAAALAGAQRLLHVSMATAGQGVLF